MKLGNRKSITVKEFEEMNGCQFTKGSINAYFLLYVNFIPEKHPIIWMKIFPMQRATEFLNVTPIRN